MHARPGLALGGLCARRRNRVPVPPGTVSHTELAGHVRAGHRTAEDVEGAGRRRRSLHRSGGTGGRVTAEMRDEGGQTRGLSGGPLRSMVVLSLAILAAPVYSASAPDWPARPVRIVAPFAPGGSADTLGRVVAEKLTVKFGQNFVVDNRAGAGGVVGSDLVAN